MEESVDDCILVYTPTLEMSDIQAVMFQQLETYLQLSQEFKELVTNRVEIIAWLVQDTDDLIQDGHPWKIGQRKGSLCPMQGDDNRLHHRN